MLDDFHLIQHKFSSTISLIPITDVHLGAIEHNKEAWEEFLRIVDKDTSIRVGLVGDLVNNSVRNSVANPFDEILRPREQKKLMVEYLSPIKDRIIFSVCGNHESRTIKEADQDIAYDIMAKLDLEDIYPPSTILAEYCYNHKLEGCSALQSIKASFTAFAPSNATSLWITANEADCTFACPEALDISIRSDSTVPSDWMIVRV